jgi:hypothetical protein
LPLAEEEATSIALTRNAISALYTQDKSKEELFQPIIQVHQVDASLFGYSYANGTDGTHYICVLFKNFSISIKNGHVLKIKQHELRCFVDGNKYISISEYEQLGQLDTSVDSPIEINHGARWATVKDLTSKIPFRCSELELIMQQSTQDLKKKQMMQTPIKELDSWISELEEITTKMHARKKNGFWNELVKGSKRMHQKLLCKPSSLSTKERTTLQEKFNSLKSAMAAKKDHQHFIGTANCTTKHLNELWQQSIVTPLHQLVTLAMVKAVQDGSKWRRLQLMLFHEAAVDNLLGLRPFSNTSSTFNGIIINSSNSNNIRIGDPSKEDSRQIADDCNIPRVGDVGEYQLTAETNSSVHLKTD